MGTGRIKKGGLRLVSITKEITLVMACAKNGKLDINKYRFIFNG